MHLVFLSVNVIQVYFTGKKTLTEPRETCSSITHSWHEPLAIQNDSIDPTTTKLLFYIMKPSVDLENKKEPTYDETFGSTLSLKKIQANNFRSERNRLKVIRVGKSEDYNRKILCRSLNHNSY